MQKLLKPEKQLHILKRRGNNDHRFIRITVGSHIFHLRRCGSRLGVFNIPSCYILAASAAHRDRLEDRNYRIYPVNFVSVLGIKLAKKAFLKSDQRGSRFFMLHIGQF